MKKLAIPFVVGITLGLGGSTGAALLLGGEPESLEESLAEALGDSAHVAAEGEHADSAGHVAEVAHDTAHAEPSDGHAADPHATADANGAQPLAPSIPGVSAYIGSTGPAPKGMSSAELAKLFATMGAREAARVLEHLEDQEVQVILGQLGNREGAAILSNLTPERAAVISRSILRGERSSQ